ncbi:MAG: carboxymuconolactone decarboxylase family protein [Planctomycetota bacterium]
MPRLNTIDPANAEGRAKELFDGPLAQMKINIFKGMANSPAALDVYLAISQGLKSSTLSAKEQETIQLAVGQANSCDYCLAAHTMIGKGAGRSDDQTVAARQQADLGDAKLTAIAKFAGALHEKKGFVSDDDLAAFKSAGYDDAAVVDAIAVYSLATFTNYFNHVNQTDVDFPAAPSI